jgi:uncharacterized membrane protein YcjF (UPF0283 family)
MNDRSQITPVTFNEATGKFNFELPCPVCDNLLLSYYNKKGMALCHSSKEELENFRQKLILFNDDIQADHSERKEALQRKMIAALFFAVFICLFVYTNDFFSEGQFYRWLFNFSTVLVLIAMYKIAVKYLLGICDHTDTTRLQRDLDLIVIHNRIRDEFSC